MCAQLQKVEGCISLCTFKCEGIFSLLVGLVIAFYLSVFYSLPWDFWNINNGCVFLRQNEYKSVSAGVFWMTFLSSPLFFNRESRSEERRTHPQTTQTEHNELGWPSAPSPCKPTPKSEHRGVLSIDGRKVGHVCTKPQCDSHSHTHTHTHIHITTYKFIFPAFSPVSCIHSSTCPKAFLSISARFMSNFDRMMAWIFSACFPGFSVWKHLCFSVSDMKLMRLGSLFWQLWPRHAVPHAPLSHVPTAWWAGGGRGDGEGAYASHPRGSLFPCCCILQSPVHSHSHSLTPRGDAADAPGCT